MQYIYLFNTDEVMMADTRALPLTALPLSPNHAINKQGLADVNDLASAADLLQAHVERLTDISQSDCPDEGMCLLGDTRLQYWSPISTVVQMWTSVKSFSTQRTLRFRSIGSTMKSRNRGRLTEYSSITLFSRRAQRSSHSPSALVSRR